MTKTIHDPEIAFTDTSQYKPLAPRGIIAALGFDYKAALSQAPQKLLSRPPFFNGMTNVWASQDFFLAGPVIGAPMAVMTLEILQRSGAEEIIFLGLSGALNPKLQIADIILPMRTVSSEGTSGHYPAPSIPSPQLTQRNSSAEFTRADACIWSTDAIYRETASLVASQKEAGADMVDMEIAALYSAAAYRGVDLAALVVISDIVGLGDHQTGFHLKEFKQAMKKAAQHAWRILGEK